MKVDFYICPECGAEVRVGSKGCAKCASQQATKRWDDEPEEKPRRPRKPWEQDEAHDGLDLPEDDFDYDDFVEREFGRGPRRPQQGWLWWGVGIGLLALFAIVLLLKGTHIW